MNRRNILKFITTFPLLNGLAGKVNGGDSELESYYKRSEKNIVNEWGHDHGKYSFRFANGTISHDNIDRLYMYSEEGHEFVDYNKEYCKSDMIICTEDGGPNGKPENLNPVYLYKDGSKVDDKVWLLSSISWSGKANSDCVDEKYCYIRIS